MAVSFIGGGNRISGKVTGKLYRIMKTSNKPVELIKVGDKYEFFFCMISSIYMYRNDEMRALNNNNDNKTSKERYYIHLIYS